MWQFSTFRWFLVAGLACLAPANQASAEVIVAYPFMFDTNPSQLGERVQSSSFDGSHLLQFVVGNDGFGNVLQAYPPNGATSAANALALNSYFTISVAAVPGNVLDLTTLQFDVGKGGNSDPRGYFIRSSVDGFASDLFATNLPMGPQQPPALQTIDLSTLSSYQGLPAIDFRFFVWAPDVDPAGILHSVDFRNLQLQGEVVPEPSSLALLAVAVAGFGLFRHSRKRFSRGDEA
jgi:hypothetical protein